eukprot:757994-Hanusia_phi.AAC.2
MSKSASQPLFTYMTDRSYKYQTSKSPSQLCLLYARHFHTPADAANSILLSKVPDGVYNLLLVCCLSKVNMNNFLDLLSFIVYPRDVTAGLQSASLTRQSAGEPRPSARVLQTQSCRRWRDEALAGGRACRCCPCDRSLK